MLNWLKANVLSPTTKVEPKQDVHIHKSDIETFQQLEQAAAQWTSFIWTERDSDSCHVQPDIGPQKAFNRDGWLEFSPLEF